ncbi:MAG: adenylyltransferase/cytidyltransferase family protein [Bacteroidales bacterium]|nr:adenylyltransferase/cytidyltransferase family protein [Bacteroidales bacterium]
MKVYYGLEEVEKIKNPVITTGTFDGVHFGHKTILGRIKKLAEQYEGESVLISFYPHPRKVLYPSTEGKCLHLITTLDEKIDLLEKEGLDNLILLEFTKEFARVSSSEFIEKYISSKLRPRVIVVGYNHHFGHNKEGNYQYLKSISALYGFDTEEIPEQEVLNETVSSTQIRKALVEGYIQRVNAYLDHFYFISGSPGKWEPDTHLNDHTGIVLRIDDEDKLLPRQGAYAVSVPGDGSKTHGLAFIPQKTEGRREVAIILFENFSPGINITHRLRINFHKRMDGKIQFDSPESLRVPEKLINDTMELIY